MTRVWTVFALCSLGLLTWSQSACEKKPIPPRNASQGQQAQVDPADYLTQGTRVFFDDFEREALGESWTTKHPGWRIESGVVRDDNAKNLGLWLNQPTPQKTRISFKIRSGSMPAGKTFPGDVKCEAFATKQEHQAGYVFINGGWSNQLDVVARLDEHGADRKEQPAARVKADEWVQWDIIRTGKDLYWFRAGSLLMHYRDESPVRGDFFGFNNWESRIAFDDLAIYELP